MASTLTAGSPNIAMDDIDSFRDSQKVASRKAFDVVLWETSKAQQQKMSEIYRKAKS